jgi:phospholipid transport system substrate-binding protein
MKALRSTAALGLALALAAGRASAAPPDAIAVVRGFYATLLQTMRQGPALGPGGRYERLAPIVHNTFDLRFMTRLAVGPGWASLSSAQQQHVTEAFGRYVAATYADRFDRYSGERFEVADEKAFGGGLIVETRIVDADAKPVAIDYMMRRGAAGWRVSDVYLDGTISELATRRSEFAAILRDRGIAGLIAALNQKSDLLSASAADAS